MSKKILCSMSVVITVTTLIVALCCGLIFSREEKLLIMPTLSGTVNYNNYVAYNYFDADGKNVSWINGGFQNKLVVSDENNNKTFMNIKPNYRILNDKLFYTNNDTLMMCDMNSNKKFAVLNNVQGFTVFDENTIYFTEKTTEKLFLYDLKKKAKTKLLDDVQCFTLSKNKVIVISNDNWVYSFSSNEKKLERLTQIDIQSYPFYFMICDNNIIYFDIDNKLHILNLENKKEKTVNFEDSEYANNKINYICNNETIFVSVQKTKTDGSIVKDVDSEFNGLWRVDVNTLDKTKVCSDTFESLQLYNSNELIAIKNNEIYLINGQTEKMVRIK